MCPGGTSMQSIRGTNNDCSLFISKFAKTRTATLTEQKFGLGSAQLLLCRSRPRVCNAIVPSVSSSVCTERVCSQLGHTSAAPPDRPLLSTPPTLLSAQFRVAAAFSPPELFRSWITAAHLPPCPTAAPSTPMWSPWPASSWSRAGRPKAPGSWPRCWTRCAPRWRPSPALCARLGSPTCEWAEKKAAFGLWHYGVHSRFLVLKRSADWVSGRRASTLAKFSRSSESVRTNP